MIPYLDLSRIHQPIKEEILESIGGLIDKSEFVLGASVETFERNFAKYCGTEYAISVNSGTSALHLSLEALGIGNGDEVIVPTMTFMATAAAVSYTGAIPRFVDVNPMTWNLEPSEIEAAINDRTKAIIPVHLHGLMAEMPAITAIAKSYGLFVIEDAAQAHGASISGQGAGTFGHVGCFSFYPGKNLGALGEGGAIVTNDAEIRDRLMLLRNWGSRNKYVHEMVAYNNRLESIQAVSLDIKLKYLDEWTAQRQKAADLYRKLLMGSTYKLSEPQDGYKHVQHIFAVQTEDRDLVTEALTTAGIGWGIHYPIPLHLQPAYSSLGYQIGDFPISENLGNTWVSLPMFPGITNEEVEAVVATLMRV